MLDADSGDIARPRRHPAVKHLRYERNANPKMVPTKMQQLPQEFKARLVD
jgi:hypothetical protein